MTNGLKESTIADIPEKEKIKGLLSNMSKR